MVIIYAVVVFLRVPVHRYIGGQAAPEPAPVRTDQPRLREERAG
jgi:hypothetical protein